MKRLAFVAAVLVSGIYFTGCIAEARMMVADPKDGGVWVLRGKSEVWYCKKLRQPECRQAKEK